MTKSELRKTYLAKRRALSADERRTASQAIADRFFAEVDMTVVRFLHCFIAIDKFNEVDTTIVFRRLWNEFTETRTVVPRVNSSTGELDSLLFTPETELAENAWGIHEPATDELVAAAEIDVVLVPLLCFDATAHRVGYGKGYYDRFLARCRPDCRKFGLSYFPPVDEISDVHDGDIRLNLTVTPDRLYPMEPAIRPAG